jgi:hypothetical protein
MSYVKPDQVLSPTRYVRGISEVLYDPGPNQMAVARILWAEEGEEPEAAVAVRWNGNDEHPLGHPVVRGKPTWFVIDGYAAEAVEAAARAKEAESPTGLSAGYRDMARDEQREREAHEWCEGLIGDEPA